LLVAREEYPGLDIEAYLTQLERLGQAVRARLGTDASPERQIATLNALLFGEEGFRGNAANYYDPRNSYLNEVLDRRLGIPLTLALVYVDVGRRAQLPLTGVGFPAHFLVAYEAEPRILIDPFTCGQILSVDDCQRLLWEAFGSSMRLEPGHLAASSKRQILTRLVTNLKVAYERAGDTRRAQRAAEQLAVVQPPAEAEAMRRHQALMRELQERRN
jgi:regulator of sirC expression with transglutaminase-like and TPR domain